jgi:hypothetical protein
MDGRPQNGGNSPYEHPERGDRPLHRRDALRRLRDGLRVLRRGRRVPHPGRSEWAGEHKGRDAAVAYIRNALEKAHQGEVELELIDRLTSDERVALLVRERFKRPEGDIVIRRANVYRILGDEIAELWIFEGDQYEVDALLGS